MSETPAPERARRGKIGRLPADLREEVCRRLHDGHTGGQILAWLNAKPETLAVLAEHFEGEPVSAQNLSDWRQGGYRDWLNRRDRVDNLKTLSAYALDLAKAGGGVSEGAAAVAGGRILEMLESLDEDNVGKLVGALASLRTSEASAINARVAQARLAQKDRELELAEARFQRQTAERFLKWYADQEARTIASSREDAGAKMEKLVQLMFGERPTAAAAEPPA
jgi:hypothetical protein